MVVKFIRRTDRYAVWSRKKQLKGTRIMITEFLIPARQQILSEARAIFTPANSWTQEGKIVVLYPDGSKDVITARDHLDASKARLLLIIKHQFSNIALNNHPYRYI